MNSFNLTLSKKHFICPSILNDSFAAESNLGCRSLPFMTSNTSFQPLLAYKISFEKSTDNLMDTWSQNEGRNEGYPKWNKAKYTGNKQWREGNWDTNQRFGLNIQEEEQKIENLFEQVMKENFPNLAKEIDFQEVQEAQRVPRSWTQGGTHQGTSSLHSPRWNRRRES